MKARNFAELAKNILILIFSCVVMAIFPAIFISVIIEVSFLWALFALSTAILAFCMHKIDREMKEARRERESARQRQRKLEESRRRAKQLESERLQLLDERRRLVEALRSVHQRKLEEARRFAEQLDSLEVPTLRLVSKYASLMDFSSGYLMKKDYDQFRVEAMPVVDQLLLVPEMHRSTHPQAEPIRVLLACYMSKTLRAQRNDKYKAHEMSACAELFDDVGGKSLDSQQRDAVVTDEYSNLVIAGAGSGKTLTVVGKVKYLVERWHVNPSEILVTSFTRKSVGELSGRIEKAGICGVSAKTFHALGLSVLDRPAVANENELKRCILRYLKTRILESPESVAAYLEFYGCYGNVPPDYGDFDSDSDRFRELKSMDLVTLKGQLFRIAEQRERAHDTLQGEKVRSLEELIIANHLFLNGVRYEYERPYDGGYETIGVRAYQPDFYLVDYDIWLEHFGIDENGRAPWLGSPGEEQKYCEAITWKREVHQRNQTKLIESYSYWNKDNKLIENLNALLLRHGVQLGRETDELVELYEELLHDEKLLRSIVELISTFVSLYKANNTTLAEVEREAMSRYRADTFMLRRYQLFITFVAPLIEYYQASLRDVGLVDFDDMINHATQVILNDGIQECYKYIIVDEYQDISASRFGLINAIRDCTGAKLVCVGDDWQSIYRFAGSDVTLFTSFGTFSGYHERLRIEGTYRNSQNLVDAASSFVMKNHNQISKVMVSRKLQQNPRPITVLSLKNQLEALAKALDEILSSGHFNGSILILGRHNFDWDSLFSGADAARASSELLGRFTARKDVNSGDIDIAYGDYRNIKFMSVHRAKGLEADEVIVLNLTNDRYGFPNKVVDDPLLNLLLADSDDHLYAEERRLFYVALTRTKNRVYLVASHLESYSGPSVFTSELLNDDEAGAVRLVTEDGERAPVHCPRCGKGVLVVRRDGKRGREFLGCTNYPFCEKTYPSTEILEDQVKCPECGGWMVKRSGSFGEFYGCTNYRDGICSATINISSNDKSSLSSSASDYQVSHTSTYVRTTGQVGVKARSVKQPRNGVPCSRLGCDGVMVRRSGPHGDFYGCSNYPRCANKAKLESTGKSARNRPSCPVCGAAMVAKTSRYGQFYSCSKYPACKGKRNR